ncbi:MAG: hypothetical protein AAF658_22355, partial [Myxococcota bacterium]
PLGGEVWVVGESRTISWEATGTTEDVTVDVSYDAGSTWQVIVVGQPSSGSYTWEVPNLPSSIGLLAVELASGERAELATPIFIALSTSITVTNPLPSSTVFPGNLVSIEWVALGFSDPVDIAYSIDGGVSFTPFSSGEYNDGGFEWTVPDTISATAVVRVEGASGTLSGDSGVFAIASAEPNLLCVDSEGPAGSGQPCWAAPFADLQSAFDAASSGDEIWVATATAPYVGGFVATAGVEVYGGFLGGEAQRAERNADLYRTTLDGNGSATVLTAADELLIDGFLITNGSGEFPAGGGVDSSASGVVLRDVWIVANATDFDGAALAVQTGDVTLERCRIADHASGSAGA